MLPRPDALELTALGTAIDYDTTPVVELELRTPASDDALLRSFDRDHRVHRFHAELPPATPAEYRFAITYTRADGTRIAGPTGRGEAPVLFVPALSLD